MCIAVSYFADSIRSDNVVFKIITHVVNDYWVCYNLLSVLHQVTACLHIYWYCYHKYLSGFVGLMALAKLISSMSPNTFTRLQFINHNATLWQVKRRNIRDCNCNSVIFSHPVVAAASSLTLWIIQTIHKATFNLDIQSSYVYCVIPPSQSAVFFFPFCVMLSARGGREEDNEMKEEENMRKHLCSSTDKSGASVCEWMLGRCSSQVDCSWDALPEHLLLWCHSDLMKQTGKQPGC